MRSRRMSGNSKPPKPWPSLPSDEAAERFVETADLSEYDWSRAEPVTHRFAQAPSERRAGANGAFDRLLETARKNAPTERDKGAYFEKLTAAFLENDPVQRAQYRNIKPFADWAKAHGWRESDTGIDLVAELVDEDGYAAIQCKFYEPNGRIQKKDIDSFLAASGKEPFTRRLIVDTTLTEWSDNAEDTIHGQTIPVLRIDLNGLRESPIKWEGFEAAGEVTLAPKKTLRPHQQEALNAVRAGLGAGGSSANGRGKLIMACGTGKTLTALKIAEDLAGAGKSILYCVPSLALMAQTVREWTNDADAPLRSFAVCSDTQVGKRRVDGNDVAEIDSLDLAFPATTDAARLADGAARTAPDKMTAVFATYQSLQVVAEAQERHGLPEFDLIVCDEAHRTTGVTLAGTDESNFVKIHDNDAIRGKKRLYMTATPRIFGEAVKAKADEAEAVLASMDDESLYGAELFRFGFSDAVEQGLLSDYRVIVLAMDEGLIGAGVQRALADGGSELRLDDATRIVGCWKALSKQGFGEDGPEGFSEGPPRRSPMRRALAFCKDIKTSKLVRDKFSAVVDEFLESDAAPENGPARLRCEVDHVDGTFNAKRRGILLDWLQADGDDDACRILTNARCLSEGVDVPALDAIMFLHPRKSQIEVVQSVGRVMRRAEGKRMGYVILPVGIPPGIPPDQALDDNDRYRAVWQILNALRAHDERLDDTINRIALGQSEAQVQVIGGDGAGNGGAGDGGEGESLSGVELAGATQSRMDLDEEFSRAVMARIVKKCGTRDYWEDWAADIAKIAQNHITRLTGILKTPETEARKAFDKFLAELRDDLNETIAEADAVEMLAQHIVTRPVFAALFEGHAFIERNPVSRAMSRVLEALDAANLDKEAGKLETFYAGVRRRAEGVTDPQARQRLMVELYDTFFRRAFPRVTERLGIVYTPVEIVDFIIRSVDDVLRAEFGQSLAAPGVHIIDPFTGTGTFIVRLLQSGLIGRDDAARKFRGEIHANEIVLLAYYIAAINIEAAYYGDAGMSEDYAPFEGVCLTDTFRMYESDDLISHYMPDNSKRRKRQKAADIRVILGNPPYSVGQHSQNDANANIIYQQINGNIHATYAKRSKATLQRNLYDSYIQAIRWASDRIGESGVVAYVTNAGWVDGKAMDGMRACLVEEFSSLYIFHLRGNIRKNMLSKAGEGSNVFGSGSMAGAAISVLVKNPDAAERGRIFFHDIGDDLSREEKLAKIREFGGVGGMSAAGKWTAITPDEHHDWLDQRDRTFDRFIKIGDKKDKAAETLFDIYSPGVVTSRDAWCTNASRAAVENNMRRMIEFYNREVDRVASHETEAARTAALDMTPSKISWSRFLKQAAARGQTFDFDRDGTLRQCLHRPFTKQWLYFSRPLNEAIGQIPALFPEPETKNRAICVTGISAGAGFSALMTDATPNFHTVGNGQAFALHRFDAAEGGGMFAGGGGKTGGAFALTRAGLKHFQAAYPGENPTAEDVFYYIYGLLHSPDYRTRYANNLSKELPRIPRVKSAEDFRAFRDAGRALGDLHVDYENADPYPVTIKQGALELAMIDDPTSYFRVAKMKFEGKGKHKDKTAVIYNEKTTMQNIPPEAWDYEVNGRPALQWVMDRQTVKTDKASGIVNDANLWAVETANDPAYPLNLFRKVMTVSIETMKIIRALPGLEVEERE